MTVDPKVYGFAVAWLGPGLPEAVVDDLAGRLQELFEDFDDQLPRDRRHFE